MKALAAIGLALLLGCSRRESDTSTAPVSQPPSRGAASSDDRIILSGQGITLLRISPGRYGRKEPDFFLQETEVTNAMFHQHLLETKGTKADDEVLRRNLEEEEERKRTHTWTSSTTDASIHMKNRSLLWKGNTPPEGKKDYPVALVSVIEANEFCLWLTSRHPELGTFRLPTVAEWTLAAYGADRDFPWGSKWNDECVRHAASSPEPATQRAKGRTPEGIYGMFGNVSEFVIHPSKEHNVFFMGVGARWLGGTFSDTSFRARQDYWGYWHNSKGRSEEIGFRVLLDPADREHRFKHTVPYDLETVGDPQKPGK